jgi:hypothetical protein
MRLKKAGSVLGGALVLGLFGAGVWYWRAQMAPPMPPKAYTIAKGAEVSLILLEPISSGGTPKGAVVDALVSEDVKSPEGAVLVKAGSLAKIEVTRSRGSTAMTNLVNQPARLSISFQPVKTVDGKALPLAPDPKGTETELEVTRKSASALHAGDAVSKLWNSPETQAPLKALQDRLTGANPQAEIKAPDIKKALGEAAKELEMNDTVRALKDDQAWAALSETLKKAGSGDLSSLGSGEAALALGALKEIGQLAGTVDDALRGMVKGSNIILPVGAKLTGYAAKPVKVAPPVEKPKR